MRWARDLSIPRSLSLCSLLALRCARRLLSYVPVAFFLFRTIFAGQTDSDLSRGSLHVHTYHIDALTGKVVRVGLNGKDRQRLAKIPKMANMPTKDGKDEFNLAKMGPKNHISPIPV